MRTRRKNKQLMSSTESAAKFKLRLASGLFLFRGRKARLPSLVSAQETRYGQTKQTERTKSAGKVAGSKRGKNYRGCKSRENSEW